MSGIRRRTVLGTALTALGVTATDATGGGEAAYAGPAATASPAPHEEALRDARMVWRRLPADWRSAPFLGNGALTAQVHGGSDPHEVNFLLAPGALANGGESAARLVLRLAGTVTAVDWTLDLWNAELAGTVTTTGGVVRFVALIPAGGRVLLVDLTPSPGEQDAGWEARPPGATLARRERRDGTRRLLVAALTASQDDAAAAVEKAGAKDRAAVLAAHRDWWHSYYRRSFVSIPDRRVQRFLWIQLCKAAAVRPGGSSGVFPAYLHTTGHGGAEAGESWTAPAGGFALPGRGARSVHAGNPVDTWDLPGLWTAYRHTLDRRVLAEQLYPALAKVLTFYEQFLVRGHDGTLHLPLTRSPGYGEVADCTYDLSLIRWAAARAADVAVLLGGRHAADAPRWRSIATSLVAPHRNAHGIMVGAGAPADRSLPLPAHLMWLDPLRERRWDRLGDRAIMRATFDRWAGMRENWHGRSYALASSMASSLDAAEEAHSHLGRVLRRDGSGLTSNTLYEEGGHATDSGASAAARAVLDMLVRSGEQPGTGSVLEVFPAVHHDWRDVSIAGLRTDGGFVVDAARANGRTEWIRIHSRTEAPLAVRHGIEGTVAVRSADGRRRDARTPSPHELLLRLAPGETVLLTPEVAPLPDPSFHNVAPLGTDLRWGLPTAGAAPGSPL